LDKQVKVFLLNSFVNNWPIVFLANSSKLANCIFG